MDVVVLRNMMNYYLDCFRLAREGIQDPMRQEDVVDFGHVTALLNTMNYHLDCYRFAMKGSHRKSQVDAILLVGFATVAAVLWNREGLVEGIQTQMN